MKKNTSGFTIVELLIVIVIIAILAAITIVAFSGIQSRARESKRISDARSVMKLIELYRIDAPDGNPPQYGNGGTFDQFLTGALVPKYAASLPSDPKYPYRYSGQQDRYAIVIYHETGGIVGDCKISSGNTTGWWGGIRECP